MTLILGLESSCDDSAAALVTGDRHILAQAVVGQNSAHQPYGGVVPEIAARAHVEILPALIQQVLRDAKLSIRDIDAVARVSLRPDIVRQIARQLRVALLTVFNPGDGFTHFVIEGLAHWDHLIRCLKHCALIRGSRTRLRQVHAGLGWSKGQVSGAHGS